MMRLRLMCPLLTGAALALPAPAQNVSLPSNDWNGSWGFSSVAEQQLRLLQADIIEKKEEGYYESLGDQTITITNNYDMSQGRMEVTASGGAQLDISNRTGTNSKIGQNTNVIGAINESETNIDVEGSGNNVEASNRALSEGCQEGSIAIRSPNATPGTATCN